MSQETERSSKDQARLIAGAIALGIALLFAVVNSEKVKVDWVVGSGKAPLVIVIAISFLLGSAVGLLIGRNRN